MKNKFWGEFMKQESVLCFSRFLLEDRYGCFEGISFNKDYAHLVMNEHNYIFVDREQAERDNHYKQIIPYAIFINENREILNYKRGDGSGENRLKSLRSIGIGGHINEVDILNWQNAPNRIMIYHGHESHEDDNMAYETVVFDNLCNYGLFREIEEELKLGNMRYKEMVDALQIDCIRSSPLAFINEEDTDVGKVHFGVVYVLRINEKLINSFEENVIVDAQFSSYDKIKKEIDFYENWSQLCLKNWSKLEG